jgi:hypothetical protein
VSSAGERPRELGPWKSVGVEEEHEIAASDAKPLVTRARLAGPTRWHRPAGQRGHAVLTGRGGAVGGFVVHDDDERRDALAGATDHHSASASGA